MNTIKNILNESILGSNGAGIKVVVKDYYSKINYHDRENFEISKDETSIICHLKMIKVTDKFKEEFPDFVKFDDDVRYLEFIKAFTNESRLPKNIDRCITLKDIKDKIIDISEFKVPQITFHNVKKTQQIKTGKTDDLFFLNSLDSNIKKIECDVKNLYFNNCDINSLEMFDGGVQNIYLKDCSEINSLKGIPDKINELCILNCSEDIDISTFPSKINKLLLRDTPLVKKEKEIREVCKVGKLIIQK
jgi:hypothetical protein